MSDPRQTRRRFLQSSVAGTTAAATAPYWFTGSRTAASETQSESKNDRPILGCIGTGDRWRSVGRNAMELSDCVAVCDVDANHLAEAVEIVKEKQDHEPAAYEDYQEVLDRKDIDAVTIVTPDHWHTKIAIAALRAGKDVYCEKPLSLTIEEGKQICQVVKETGRVFQVGTQQRSEMNLCFLQAVAMVHAGRIGKVERVDVAIGGAPVSGVIPKTDPPAGLNWDKWLGQAPEVDYRFQSKEGARWGNSRCHYEFRWWYEYSGGKLTDWGAHHVDIAQWAIDQLGEGQGPTSIEPVEVVHPVPFQYGNPTRGDEYNCATKFTIRVDFPNGVVMNIRDSCADDPSLDFTNGIMFTGEKGRFFVSRGKLAGKPVEDLQDNPLPENALAKAYKGKVPGGKNAHMANFFECVKSRDEPISDVFTHHRALTTCHLANIAIRLGRGLQWDARSQQMVGDDAANAWQTRDQRVGYEIEV
jgi:predicted dehydrogenase